MADEEMVWVCMAEGLGVRGICGGLIFGPGTVRVPAAFARALGLAPVAVPEWWEDSEARAQRTLTRKVKGGSKRG